ncbi:MAG: GtrA family protein [Dehalococcoidia bacterium]|nr:GtrA family protein [Dehalococcoidia bacterium]
MDRAVRFLVVGALVTTINFAVFNVVLLFAHDISRPYVLLANTIAFVVAATVGYQLHARVTFRADRDWRGFGAFAMVAIAGITIDNATLTLLLLPFDSNHRLTLNLAKAGAAVVAALWNYQGYRVFAFGQRWRRRSSVDVTA